MVRAVDKRVSGIVTPPFDCVQRPPLDMGAMSIV